MTCLCKLYSDSLSNTRGGRTLSFIVGPNLKFTWPIPDHSNQILKPQTFEPLGLCTITCRLTPNQTEPIHLWINQTVFKPNLEISNIRLEAVVKILT